jgi:protein-S-isoprenylcysteine O-methyltransferase Ste14
MARSFLSHITTWRSALMCAQQHTLTRKDSTHSAVSEGIYRWSKPLLSAVCLFLLCMCVHLLKRLYNPDNCLFFLSFENEHVSVSVLTSFDLFQTFQNRHKK